MVLLMLYRMPITDYTPDMPAFENPGSDSILNCVPITTQSYGPFLDLATFGSSVGSQVLGAIAAEDSSGNNYVFAGTANNLFMYQGPTAVNVSNGAATFNILTETGDHIVTESGDPIITESGPAVPYNVAAGERWRFVQFGQRVIATDFDDPVQSYTLGSSSSFSNLSAGAPRARYAAAISGFLMLGNTEDATNGSQPQRCWWSALNDPTNFPTPGTSTAAALQSSFNDLFGDAGWVQGIVGNLGNADGAVFQERAVWRVMYAGPPATFSFLPAEGVKGCLAPNSIIHLGPYAYYWAQDGIYKFDGGSSVPLGANRVDRTVLGLVDLSNIHRVDGCVDPSRKLIYWAFPSLANTDGNPDTILCYNWVLDKFSLITGVTAETILYSMSFGSTLTSPPDIILSQSSIPWASRQWTGGNLILSGFTAEHQLGYFNGMALQATIDTSEQQPFQGQLAFVQNTRPLADGGLPTVALAARNRLIDNAVYNQARSINSIGTCPNTANGRYIRAQTVIPAGSQWTNFQGVELECVPNGVQ